jgi:FecR protein
MKKIYHAPLAGVVCVLFLLLAISQLTIAAQKREARVTQVIRDVRVLPSGEAPRPASLNDMISGGTVLRTGGDSRAEVTFPDQSLSRLGANSVFSFAQGGKEFDLNSGAILLAVPKSSGEVRIKTPAATAAVTGFTLIYEFHRTGVSKVLLLDGDLSLRLKGMPSPCHLTGGHMFVIPSHPGKCPDVLTFDVDKVFRTAKLITQKPLPKWARDPIFGVIEDQKNSPPPGGFTDPTSIDTLDQGVKAMPTPPIRTGPPPGF